MNVLRVRFMVDEVALMQISFSVLRFYSVGTILLMLCTHHLNTLRTGDADLRFYITTVQDG